MALWNIKRLGSVFTNGKAFISIGPHQSKYKFLFIAKVLGVIVERENALATHPKMRLAKFGKKRYAQLNLNVRKTTNDFSA